MLRRTVPSQFAVRGIFSTSFSSSVGKHIAPHIDKCSPYHEKAEPSISKQKSPGNTPEKSSKLEKIGWTFSFRPQRPPPRALAGHASNVCVVEIACPFSFSLSCSNKGVLCTAKKKGGGSARFHHSARCASKWRRPNLREAEPQEILCFAMRVSDLGSLFVFFEGFGLVREHSDQHQWQHRLFDKRNKQNLDLVKFSQKHTTHLFLTENRALPGGDHDSMDFFHPAVVDSEIAGAV